MLKSRRSLVTMLVMATFGLAACAEVAAPMPPQSPPTVRHQAESLPEEGQPPTALTAATDTPPARAERPWLPNLERGAQSREDGVSEPASAFIESCLFEIDPSLEAALVAEALPTPPPTQLDEPDPDCDP